MDHGAQTTQPVPKPRGPGESGDHWLENLELERGSLSEEGEDPAEAEGEDEAGEELEEELEPEEDEDFRP